MFPTDTQFSYLMNALFTPLDMTDYEDNFVGLNEVGGSLPISHINNLRPLVDEPFPAAHMRAANEKMEKRPMRARSMIHRETLETREAEAEAEDEEEEEEDYGEEGEGEEGEGEGESDYGAEDYGAEEETWPPVDKQAHPDPESRYFKHGENLKNKFNELELDSFMKLLNVKPHNQW